MFVGMLTAPLSRKPFEKSLKVAKAAGLKGLEIAAGKGSKSMDPYAVTAAKAKALRQKVQTAKLQITSIAHYTNLTPADPAVAKEAAANVKACVDLAAKLGVDTVCTLAGLPHSGKTREEMLDTDFRENMTPIVEYAAKKKIRIAMENWFATNIQNMVEWRKAFAVIPAENLGLNYDPSHLFWLGIDYISAVFEFGPRIFHTHAKDTVVYKHILRDVGVQGRGWWRYVIPGLGNIDWGEYIGALRRVGYDGTLSIEHEDGAVGLEEGFRIGTQHLSQFI